MCPSATAKAQFATQFRENRITGINLADKIVSELKNPWVKYLLHVIGWLLVLLLPYLFSFKKAVQFDRLWTNPHDLQNLLSWSLLIGFSYANHLWLIPCFYLERRRWAYFAIVGVGLACILLLPELVDLIVPAKPFSMPDSSRPLKPSVVMENSHFLLLFVVSVLVSITYLTQIRLRETEQQRLETELAHLKAQIQPHFLFNTLNSIYALAIRKDNKTADTVVQLAEFLRYVIRDTHHHQVALEKELAYIRNYIDLQRSRLRDSITIEFEWDGEPDGLQIAPLILFSFIENAFKHGVSPEEESEIRIKISILEKHLKLSVYNKKVKVSHAEPDAGIGVRNARKRLKLLYPDKHNLNIVDTDTDYSVELIIAIGLTEGLTKNNNG